MSQSDLLRELSKRPLLCDGAMGTQLMARGLVAGSAGELWNLDHPDDVQAIHSAYRAAGCDLLTTNTFGGTAFSLGKYGLSEKAFEVNRAGAALARKAVGETAWVLGDMGPFGDFLEPMGDTTPDQLHRIFSDQARALVDGGADALLVETMADPAELAIAVRAAKALGKPVVATFTFNRASNGFRTMMGTNPTTAVAAALDAGADVVGTNCGTSLSLEDYVHLAAELVAAAGKTPVIVQPNAGSPQTINGKLVYGATPAAMATVVPQLLSVGVKIIGGCCGTTPEILAAMGRKM